jgi:chromosome segregation ATPase
MTEPETLPTVGEIARRLGREANTIRKGDNRMSLTTLFEKIAGKQKQREKARIDDFRALVRSIGTGKEPDADQVDRVLRDTGKSLDDLRASVELYQRRFALRAQINSLPKLEAERREIEQKIARAVQALETAERLYDETTYPLTGRLEILKQAMFDAERARQEMVETCPYAELRENLHDLERRRTEAHDRAFKLRQTISDCRGWAQADRDQLPHALSAEKEQALRARAEHHEAKVTRFEKELAEVLKQITALEKQIQPLRDEMLEP